MNKLLATMLVTGLLLGASACSDESVEPPSTAPGDEALSFLRADQYQNLHAEIDYMVDRAPSDFAKDLIAGEIKSLLSKPGTMTVEVDTAIAAAGDDVAYTLDAIRQIELDNRRHYTEGSTVSAYFLFLDGHYHEDDATTKVLGLAYSGSSVVLFRDTIGALCEPIALQIASSHSVSRAALPAQAPSLAATLRRRTTRTTKAWLIGWGS